MSHYFIRLHLGTAPLLTIVRNELRKFQHQTIAIPPKTDNPDEFLIDHIEIRTDTDSIVRRSSEIENTVLFAIENPVIGFFDDSLAFSEVLDNPPEILIPVRIYYSSKNRVISGKEPLDVEGNLIIAVEASMNRETKGAQPVTTFRIITLRTIPEHTPIDDLVLAMKLGIMGKTIDIPLNLDFLEQILNGDITLDITNYGVSINTTPGSILAASQISFMWECGKPYPSTSDWQNFLNGSLGDVLSGVNGFMFQLPPKMLTDWSEAKTNNQLNAEANKEDPKIEILQYAEASWNSFIGPIFLSTTFDVDVIIPVIPNVGVTITSYTSFSLNSAGQLQLDTTIDRDIYDGDIFKDFLVGTGPVTVGELIANITGLIVLGDVAEHYQADATSLQDGCAWVIENEKFSCIYDIPLPTFLHGEVWHLIVDEDGLKFDGVINLTDTNPWLPWFNSDPKIEWDGGTYCQPTLPAVHLVLAKPLGGYYVEHEVLEDLANQFKPFVYFVNGELFLSMSEADIVGGSYPTFHGWPSNSYFADPYPCKVWVRMSNGMALIVTNNIPILHTEPLHRQTNEEKLQGIKEAGERKINCTKTAYWNPEKFFWRKWLVDPPPDYYRELPEEHLWEVEIYDREENAKIVIEDRQGELATVVAGSKSRIKVAILKLADASDLLRVRAGNEFKGKETSISIQQTSISKVSEIDLGVQAENVIVKAMSPPSAVCIGKDDVVIISLEYPEMPMIDGRLKQIRGMHSRHHEIFTWGKQGVQLRQKNKSAIQHEFINHPVIDLALGIGNHYVLTPTGLELYDETWTLKQKTKIVAPAFQVLSIGNDAVLASTKGISIYTNHHDQLKLEAWLPFTGVARLFHSSQSGRRSLRVMLNKGKSFGLDLSNPQKPRITDTIEHDRYTSMVRHGDILTRLAKHGRGLEVFRINKRIQLSRMELEDRKIKEVQVKPLTPSMND